MKTFKKITLSLMTLILVSMSSSNVFAQDTVYVSMKTVNQSTRVKPVDFVKDSITNVVIDTFYNNTYSYTLHTPPQTTKFTYSIVIPNSYSKYILEYELIDKAFQYSYEVSINNNIIKSGSSSSLKSNNLQDTVLVNSGDSVNFMISNTSNTGKYDVFARVLHTVDTIFYNPKVITNIFDNKIEDKVDFSIFPNPTVRSLNVDMDNITSDATLNIFDITGKLVRQGNLDNPSIDVSDLNKGTYIIMVVDRQRMASKRFMKQ